MTTPSFNDFVMWVGLHRGKYMRLGQCAFNTLSTMRPDLGVLVTSHPEVDPFYDDTKLERFYQFVEENWDGIVL